MKTSLFLLGVVLACTGCVLKSDHQATLVRLHAAETNAEQARAFAIDAHKELEAAKLEVEEKTKEIEQRDKVLGEVSVAKANVEKKLEETTAKSDELAQRLRVAGQTADRLATERSELAKGLDEARANVEAMKKARDEAEVAAQMMRDLEAQTAKMHEADKQAEPPKPSRSPHRMGKRAQSTLGR